MPTFTALLLLLSVATLGCAARSDAAAEVESAPPAAVGRLELDESTWRQRLTAEQFKVLRQAGTERPGSSPLLKEKRAGTYVCAGCDLPLFDASTKFESGSGWPSFWAPINAAHVLDKRDLSLGMLRTENVCARCDGHLGHVFEDGPRPTGLRYCMNGAALKFVPQR